MKEEPANNRIQLDKQAKHFVDPETRFKLILSVYVIMIKDGKVLLLRRANTGYEDGKYGLPAGHADGDEPGRQAAAREAKEEVGVDIDPTDMKFVHCMHRRQNDERVDFFYTAEKWQGKTANMEPQKCDDVSWHPLDNLPKNTIPYIKKVLEAYHQDIYYLEFWEGNT